MTAEIFRLSPPPKAERPSELVLPHNVEVEQALLAAIMVQPRCFEMVSSFLKGEHFAEPVHGRIFDACARLIGEGRSATPVTLRTLFDADAALETVGGSQYLARLAASVVTLINAPDYGRTIIELWRRREQVRLALDIIDTACEPSLDPTSETVAEEAERRLFKIMDAGTADGGARPLAEIATESIEATEAAWKAGGRIVGVTTGFADLDKRLGGMQAEDLLVLAARPSMGKSTLATNIALAAARSFVAEALGTSRKAKAVVYFSLEMGAKSVSQVFLARESEVSAERQRRGHVGGLGDFDRLIAAQGEFRALPIFIDTRASASAGHVRGQVRRVARRNVIGLIVVDYLQLMRQDAKVENRRLEVGEITGALKALAKDQGCPILLLSQLNRAVELREDRRPMLGDLRESGDIEQDADVVMFLYRDEYYLARAEPRQKADEEESRFADRLVKWRARCEAAAHKAELIVAKNRMGSTGPEMLRYEPEVSKFENLYGGGSL